MIQRESVWLMLSQIAKTKTTNNQGFRYVCISLKLQIGILQQTEYINNFKIRLLF